MDGIPNIDTGFLALPASSAIAMWIRLNISADVLSPGKYGMQSWGFLGFDSHSLRGFWTVNVQTDSARMPPAPSSPSMNLTGPTLTLLLDTTMIPASALGLFSYKPRVSSRGPAICLSKLFAERCQAEVNVDLAQHCQRLSCYTQ